MQHARPHAVRNPRKAGLDELERSLIAVRKPPPAAVERGRLLELIDRGARGRLTLVSAPAGTGKTAAVAMWVDSGRAPGRVVWITLGESTDASQLWALLAEALCQAGVGDREVLHSAPGSTDALLAVLAMRVLACPEPVVLVLDCPVDLPQDTAAELHELLTAAAGQLRLITLSRADPPLPLHLYRLDEALTEIRIADLAFTAPEACELLRRRGAPIPRDVADVLVARTRGWAAGLVMAAMSLAQLGDVREGVRHMDGASGPIAEYLLAEVLGRQTASVRDLLLRTSVVETLRPGLTEALGGPHASHALAFLTRGNAFLEELPEVPSWYRYHPLFRELLVAQLTHEAPEQARELHLVAARWLAAEGMVADAVRTALAAHAWDEAAGIVIENLAVAQLVPRHGAGRLRPLFRALPPTATSTAAMLVRAALALGSHRYETCAQLLERAVARDGAAAPLSSAESLTRAVLSAVAVAASNAPAERVLAEVARARRLLDADDRPAAHTELLLLVEDAAAEALFREGQFAEAAEASRVAMAAADGQAAAAQVTCAGRLAFIAAWTGHCRRAIRLAERANGLRTAAKLPASCAPLCEIALAWAYTETGEASRAMRHASAARSAAGAAESTSRAGLTRVAAAIVRARCRRAQGDLRGAHAALAEGGRSGAEAPTWARDQMVVEQAVVHLLEGEPRRVLDLPRSLSRSVREVASIVRTEAELLSVDREVPAAARTTTPGDDLSIRVRKSLLDALFHARRGNERAFGEAIERALRMAAPEHLRRPFKEAPEPIRKALATRSDLTARHPWLADAESGSSRARPAPGSSGADGDSSSLIEPLTGKELEVLGLLAQLLTTEETAAAMFVSVNTVRTHVRNILRKMGVARRHQAIRRAWDLGILPVA